MPIYSASYDRKMMNRALAAWARGQTKSTVLFVQASPERSGLKHFEGKNYIVLRDSQSKLLAIYRIQDGKNMLQRLKRWPEELTE